MIAPNWETFFAEARAVDIVETANRLGAKLKKSGRDFVGPCPHGCSERDGFVVTPAKGLFLCRKSGASGDVIAMVEHCQDVSTTEAAEFVTGHDRPRSGDDAKEKDERGATERAARDAKVARNRALQERLDAAKLKRDGEAISSIIERAVAIDGTHAGDYLAARKAGMPRSMTKDLRFVDQLHYWGFADGETEDHSLLATLPAMVAIVRNIAGDLIGLHVTYLDPRVPKKWTAPWEVDVPKGLRRNNAKKFRRASETLKGGMIRLGIITDTLVIGEGIETVGGYFRRGFVPEDFSFAVAMDLGNMVGESLNMIDHPSKRDANNKPISIPNGIPDPLRPGVLLPAHVKRVVLLGDGDSDELSTKARLLTGGRRFRDEGREVFIDMAPQGEDFASMAETGA